MTIWRRPYGVRQHQQPHRHQRKPVKGAVISNRHQPQKRAILYQQVIEIMEYPGINGEPESVVRRQHPRKKQRKAGNIH